jgi:hypothetical protein
MKRVCPNPIPWSRAFERLSAHAQSALCVPAFPPRPLILGGWIYSNDQDKIERWNKTVAWAESNGCSEIVEEIPDSEFYFVEILITYDVGPSGGPMYLPWDFTPKPRRSWEDSKKYLTMLVDNWSRIVGEDLGRVTRPCKFSGKKLRRLLAYADANVCPPWGSWFRLSRLESERRTFTEFRAALNTAITPHKVDHVDFITDIKTRATSR